MLRFIIAALLLSPSSAFVATNPYATVTSSTSGLHGHKDAREEQLMKQSAFTAGSFVEFSEKKRTHVGKIETVEQKSSGAARYQVIDSNGKKYNVPDKDIQYSMVCPNSPDQATKLYDEFCAAQDFVLPSIQKAIDVYPDLLEMTWEEAAAEENESHSLTPESFIELIHAHEASAMEKYLAWKFLQSEQSHIFFQEIKSNGRVVSFKAKTPKHVSAAKEIFCRTHQDENEICFV